MRIGKLSGLCVCLLALGCGLGGSRKSSNQPAIRNVPIDARAGNNVRKRILVLPFIDEKTSRSDKVIKVARSTVVRSLARTNRFVIVKNSDFSHDLGKYITEQREYDLERIAPIAASLGISAIVEGKILEVKAKRIGDQVGLFRKVKARVETSIRLRVMASRNSRIIMEDVRKGKVESSTTRVAEYSYSDRYLEEDPKLIQESVTKAFYGTIGNVVRSVEKISWEGRVALINGDRVFVNAGRVSGIQVGDILKVTEEGAEVFDPDTGTFIGRAPGRMKGTLEVVTYFGKDGSICLVHSGAGFRENDRVELY